MRTQGDCLEILKTMQSDSIDSLVTDPPAGISFMGKEWDKSEGHIPFMTNVMKECLRVLKPGAHGLVWAIPRTSHWTATACEAAGFEIRDVITHLFGSGFPKSLDISKAIDKAAGAEREVVGRNVTARISHGADKRNLEQGKRDKEYGAETGCDITAPSTPDAKRWQGWGTALKPASEHWVLVRKPLEHKHTVAANVLKWGTGGINIDASRIGPRDRLDYGLKNSVRSNSNTYGADPTSADFNSSIGRFPANLVLSHNEDCVEACTPGCAVAMLDEQSGTLKSGGGNKRNTEPNLFRGKISHRDMVESIADTGGASRFFYCAKASKSERNLGCEGLEKKLRSDADGLKMSDPRMASTQNRIGNENSHPTVKPIKLMSYLIRLITPPGGVVLDPFMGSGSTGVAAIQCGFEFIGIEREAEYTQIAEKRIYHAFPRITFKTNGDSS